MAEITLVIGSETRCTDNKAPGEVRSVVIDRSKRKVTHLVVEPKGRVGLARLVPLDHVNAVPGMVWLRYTEEEFKNLRAAEEAPSLEAELEDGYRPADVEPSPGETVAGAIDIVPRLVGKTKEEERSGDRIHATDGDIGQLRALSIDSRTHQVTHVHVLLKEGHLWRHKEEVAISADKVSSFDAGIHLNISQQQVEDLVHGDIR